MLDFLDIQCQLGPDKSRFIWIGVILASAFITSAVLVASALLVRKSLLKLNQEESRVVIVEKIELEDTKCTLEIKLQDIGC